MGLIKEFKEFAMRGNVLDMAVGIVIGGAFGKIVSSFVEDILMPPIGVLLGGVNFSDLKIVFKQAVMDGENVVTGGRVALRQLHPSHLRLLDHRLCHLHAAQGGQQVQQEEGGSSRSARGTTC